MADSTEMLNLIGHAAKLLEYHRDRTVESGYDRTACAVAMAHGAAVLRMVGACMVTEAGPTSVRAAARAAIEPGTFDPLALFEALNRKRVAEGSPSWRTVAHLLGVSPSTLTRLRHAQQPDVGSVVRLLAWLGTTDLAPFVGAQREESADG
jgi:hypothetical protein